MSVAGIPQDHPDRNILKKSFHRRNDSGELDVFEAARYFSGYNEAAGSYNNVSSFTHHHQKIMKDDNRSWRGGRISLDMPIRHVLNPQQQHINMDHKQIMIKDSKKYKQPSSPGGRLASFLNSLFNQSTSKKKKPKSSLTTTQSLKDDHEDSPGGRRKRRSSISHFRSSSTAATTADAKSFYSSSSSGFRTPPPYAQTPTKSYKEFKSFSKQNNINNNNSTSSSSTTTNNTVNNGSTSTTSTNNINDDEDDDHDQDDDLKDLVLMKENNAQVVSEKDKICVEKKLGLLRSLDHEDNEDDGADSDSSSDLFELQNYDLGCYSSDLPVYETTNMDNINRRSGQPISNASM